jgi:hypothetical protein
MQSKSKHTLIQAVLVLVVIALGWFLFGGSEEPEAVTEKPQLQDSTPPAEAPPTVTGIDTVGADEEPVEDMQPTRTAKRIINSPNSLAKPAASGTAEPRPAANWENEYEAADALEAALLGDIDEAISISDLVLDCRAGYENETVVQNNIDRMAKNAKQGRPLPGLFMSGTGSTREFKTSQEYESFVWNQYAKCQTTRTLFDKNLRNRLQQMAEAGNVHARYMYAMWVPTQSGLNNDDLLDWMTYQSHAMDFTWQNIREGEPLGLLAYGRSLEQSGHVYFTPRHTRYGPAFIMAAYKCGLDNPTVNQKIGNMTSQWQLRNQTTASNSASSMSDLIARTFCR